MPTKSVKPAKRKTQQTKASATNGKVQDAKQTSMLTVAQNEQPQRIGDYLDMWLCLIATRSVETQFGVSTVGTVFDEMGNRFDVWLSSILARDLARYKLPVVFCPTQTGRAYVLSTESPPDEVIKTFEVWINNLT